MQTPCINIDVTFKTSVGVRIMLSENVVVRDKKLQEGKIRLIICFAN